MERILNPIKKPLRDGGEVFITVKYDGGRLSITGVEGPLRSGDAHGACGQIYMHLREEGRSNWTYNAGWDATTMDRLLKVWDRWHLNDMKAVTPTQEAFIKGWEMGGAEYNALNHYDRVCGALRAADLLVDNGYRYGTAWLKEDVPSEVIEFLFNLPESKRTPAWH